MTTALPKHGIPRFRWRRLHEVAMNLPLRLHHAALAVRPDECEKVLSFYTGVLGLPLVRSFSKPPKTIFMLSMGGALLEIVSGAESGNNGPFFHLALETERPEDVDAWFARCVASGCTPAVPPSSSACDAKGPDGTQGPFGFRNAFCLGPAGESLEFFCEAGHGE